MVSRLVENTRLVPWIDWNEWDNVRLLAFSKDPASRKQAANLVWMWSSRLRKLPPAVKITAELVSLRHHLDVGNKADCAWCLAASMCIVRAVNLLVESKQKKRYAVSISSIAEKLKIPLWLVRLRHQATHNPQMPSPKLISKACGRLLTWLKKNYWDAQSKHVHDANQKVISILKEIAIDKSKGILLTKKERRLIDKICSIETIDTPNKTIASLFIKNNLLFNNEQAKNQFPINGFKNSSALTWAGVLEELDCKFPGMMLELMKHCVRYLNEISNDTHTNANFVAQVSCYARFCFLRRIKTNFVDCMKIIAAHPSSITKTLLRDAIKSYPEKKESINRIIDALSMLTKNQYSLVEVPSVLEPHQNIPLSPPMVVEPWSLANELDWKIPCPIGMLPGKQPYSV